MFWRGCALTGGLPSSLWWREHNLEVPWAVRGVHFIQDCRSSNVSPVAKAVDGQCCSSSALVNFNYFEGLPLNIVK